jgi:hypothetical protein
MLIRSCRLPRLRWAGMRSPIRRPATCGKASGLSCSSDRAGLNGDSVVVAFMVESASGPEGSPPRLCLCCGEQTATRSIPACWDHWIALPEDLRSAIVISYGRGQLNRYGESLAEAVRFWRHTGLWRPKYVRASAPLKPEPLISLRSRDDGKVVSFPLSRPKPSSGPGRKAEFAGGFKCQAVEKLRQTCSTG